jgi:hypothetical protein
MKLKVAPFAPVSSWRLSRDSLDDLLVFSDFHALVSTYL